MTSDKYYLTKNDGITFEEMTLEELGREVLCHDGRDYKVVADFNLAIKAQNRPWQTLHHEYAVSTDEVEIDISREIYHLLLEKVGRDFLDGGWRNDVPDRWQVYDEEVYQVVLRNNKEQEK